MLIEITNWVKVLDVIAKKTKRTKIDICREAGFDGNARGALCGSTTIPDPRHSEGEVLLALFRSVSKAKIPRISKSHEVRCPCCSILTPRGEIMRMSSNKFRCITCVDNAKNKRR